MKIERSFVDIGKRSDKLRSWLHEPGGRLGLISSIDGDQLITLVLNTESCTAEVWESPLSENSYPSLTGSFPQCHWYERFVWDMFGLIPHGHPRLKHNLLHEPYEPDLVPLQKRHPVELAKLHRDYHHMEVQGKGVYEIPVRTNPRRHH